MKKILMEESIEIIDILDKWNFFYGGRAGRELWSKKPKSIQNEDIENFKNDILKVRKFVEMVVRENDR